jgi:2-amino-4-hydroxy-6-hydroxymethyldihydropteridine diphosphokinase
MTPGPAAPASVVLALGSNLGDRAATLADAARVIADIEGLDLDGVSPVFESAAVKPHGVDPAAPPYLNAVLTARYTGDPHALLDAINAVENDHGRVRAERWGDRTLDIDIIVFGELRLADDRLTIPHPRAWQRDFVLAPWLALDPDAVIPGKGRVDELLAAAGSSVRPQAEAPGAGGRR